MCLSLTSWWPDYRGESHCRHIAAWIDTIILTIVESSLWRVCRTLVDVRESILLVTPQTRIRQWSSPQLPKDSSPTDRALLEELDEILRVPSLINFMLCNLSSVCVDPGWIRIRTPCPREIFPTNQGLAWLALDQLVSWLVEEFVYFVFEQFRLETIFSVFKWV